MAGALSTARRRSLLPWLRRPPLAGLRELEELMERMWDEDGEGWESPLLAPPLDVSETEDSVKVKLDVPGVAPEEIDVQISGGQLTICGERKEEKKVEGESFHRIERRSGRFSRTMTLPCSVVEGKVEAKCKDGVLTVTLPKSAEGRGRHIKVKT